MSRRLVIVALAIAPLGLGALLLRVDAQPLETKRPRTFAVGISRAGSPCDRGDTARRGFSFAPLPKGPLTVAWRQHVGSSLDRAPLTDDRGHVFALTSRGEVVTLKHDDGSEIARVTTGASSPGPAALLSDGTVVFVSQSGDAIGTRNEVLRFRTRVSTPGDTAGAPLPLEDGGVAIATSSELLVLDNEGGIRSRARSVETITSPLVAARGGVLGVARSGVVYAWEPGRDPVRVGDFGGPTEGAAYSEGQLFAVVSNRRLVALDPRSGNVVPRFERAGAVVLGPPALWGATAHVFSLGALGTSLVAVGTEARELTRFASGLWVSSDGGAPALPPPGGALVEGVGTVAFVTPEGELGVVGAGGLPAFVDNPCGGRLGTRRQVVALAPGDGAGFVFACANGSIAKVTGVDAR
jgi:outer membrane protein assembly factor BamB